MRRQRVEAPIFDWNKPRGYGWRVSLPRSAWPKVHEALIDLTKGRYQAASWNGCMVVSLSREHAEAVEALLPPGQVAIEREHRE